MNARSSTARHRWLLALLIGHFVLNLLLTAGALTERARDWEIVYVGLCFASFSTVVLIAGWAALGSRPAGIRMVESLATLAIMLSALMLAIVRTQFISDELVSVKIGLFAGTFVTLLYIRLIAGWRIAYIAEDGGLMSAQGERRFALRSLFRLILLVAIAAALGRGFLSWKLSGAFFAIGKLSFIAAIVATGGLLWLIPLMLEIKDRSRWIWRGGLSLMCTGWMFGVIALISQASDVLIMLGFSCTFLLPVLVLSLWMLRRAGYRLITRREMRALATRLQIATNANQDGSPLGEVRPAQVTP